MKEAYQIDSAHSGAHFVVRHMMITNVRGSFGSVKGNVVYDPDNLGDSKVEATIDIGSIRTNDEQRDAHLKSADFLNAEQYPTISFKSKKIERSGSEELKVTGDLTIHGVTKEVTLNVEGPTPAGKDPFGNTRIGAAATTKIRRSDFGLVYNAVLETGGVLIGDDVKIELEISLIKS